MCPPSSYLAVQHSVGKLMQGVIKALPRLGYHVVLLRTTDYLQDNVTAKLVAAANRSLVLPADLQVYNLLHCRISFLG